MNLNKKLSQQELDYYTRQLMLEDFGVKSQIRLKESSVLLIGVGGVGSPVATYLTGLGIGSLTIVDNDVVSFSNLHRQVLFDVDSIGKSKAIIAKKKLEKLNPYIQINTITNRLTLENSSEFDIREFDLIIDTSDNFETKVLSNKLSIANKVALLSGGVQGLNFQAGIFNINKHSACLSCLYPEMNQLTNSERVGVLGVTAGLDGMMLVNIASNFLLNRNKFLDSTLYTYDLKNIELKKYNLSKNKDCKLCFS
ncbi:MULTISPECIES: HesA/MoeB/ThiF family protein [unclassified Francisella]|uniref:HesA/MoeB/ThiF family protein n=1 Tax=unclassified Francisella TaxID=2610885 RepID=UPI002E3531DE|nr:MULTISPECIES: HesA/MoeB/ThiF family protein [unclassified Francisella]MED7819866.1 HesA/MoeB/ThiF family protein [Francisella sp. 19S2-4]MED7830670.1 HesA/MoeB/ThiF family protein [Francisella sp. 19S2-10]